MSSFSPWPSRRGAASIFFNDTVYLIGGASVWNSSLLYNDVWKSDESDLPFSKCTMSINFLQKLGRISLLGAFSPRTFHTVIVVDQYLWLFGGFSFSCPTSACNDVWSSVDGGNRFTTMYTLTPFKLFGSQLFLLCGLGAGRMLQHCMNNLPG